MTINFNCPPSSLLPTRCKRTMSSTSIRTQTPSAAKITITFLQWAYPGDTARIFMMSISSTLTAAGPSLLEIASSLAKATTRQACHHHSSHQPILLSLVELVGIRVRGTYSHIRPKSHSRGSSKLTFSRNVRVISRATNREVSSTKPR